jgi:hypothetical protein
MKVIFSKYAQMELEDAVLFHELELEGLGWRFKEEVRDMEIINIPFICRVDKR